ncbi:MAG TPA: hypothetical protein ENN73_01845 [Firmicutes bacterium]|nr:hypothetical protein [Bacillota bacterium]
MNVKGSAIVSSLAYIKHYYGDSGLEKILNEMQAEESSRLREKIFPSMWYPLSLFVNINKVTDLVYGTGDLSIVRKMGEFGAEHDLKTIYRLFYKIGSPDYIIKRASQVFTTYYDQGKFVIKDSGNKYVVFELTDFPEISEAYIQRVAGWMSKTLELSGGKSPKVSIARKQVSESELVEFKVNWL